LGKELLNLLPIPDAKEMSANLSAQRFVILDLETTGFNPRRGDRVISLGAVVVKGAVADESKTFYQLVNPGRPIPPEITALTGISDSMVSEAPVFAETLLDFFRWADGAKLAGHAVSFDMAFIHNCLSKEGIRKRPPSALDTRELAATLFPELKVLSLEKICAHLQLPLTGRHHALGDALAAAKVLEACFTELEGWGVSTLKELRSFLRYRRLLTPALSLVGG